MHDSGRSLVCSLLLVAAAAPAWGQGAAGPRSKLYLTDGWRIRTAHGLTTTTTSQVTGGDGGAISVLNGSMWLFDIQGHPGRNHEYDLNGVPTGNTSTPFHDDPVETFLDGTTDGTWAYALASIDLPRGVYRAGVDWNDPVRLFDPGYWGAAITYDVVTNTLWMAGDGVGRIDQWTMDGVFVGSIHTSAARIGALAMDHADGTLWFLDRGREVHALMNYSTDGAYLGQVSVTSGNDNFWGGEFELQSTPSVPEPFSIVLLGTGLAGIAAIRRRRGRPAGRD